MALKSKAAVLIAPHELEIRELDVPEVAEDDAILRVEASGICGADLPVFDGSNLTLRGERFYHYPVILGHEIVGRIDKIGRLASERWGVVEGDRVILERWIPCGRCNHCFSGNYRLCIQYGEGGVPIVYGASPTTLESGLWGGYSEYLYLHPSTVLYKVSDNVTADIWPLFTPLGNMISWLQREGGLGIGTRVVIQGPGPEGLAGVAIAAAAGAAEIIVTGLSGDRDRLALATQLGATAVVDIGENDPVEVVRELTGGEMADIVVDATAGDPQQPLDAGLAMLRTGGKFIEGAFHSGRTANFELDKLMNRSLSMHGVVGRDRASLIAAIRMMEKGRLPLHLLSGGTVSLDKVPEVFALLSDPSQAPVGMISVTPGS